jgi:hypothetical protein
MLGSSGSRLLCHEADRRLAADRVADAGAKRSRRDHHSFRRVKEPRSGRLATADADLPSLSHGHHVGDSTSLLGADRKTRRR